MMRKVDATQGKLPKQIIIYTIPLILMSKKVFAKKYNKKN